MFRKFKVGRETYYVNVSEILWLTVDPSGDGKVFFKRAPSEVSRLPKELIDELTKHLDACWINE